MSVRVLIVDESETIRNQLRIQLERMGCEVVGEAGNTSQALALFRARSPSVVILDIAVPQTAGIGALALLRIMRSEQPAVRVLTMGLLTLIEVRKSFLQEGATDYLIRPCNLQGFAHLCKRLEEMLPEAMEKTAAPRSVLQPVNYHQPSRM